MNRSGLGLHPDAARVLGTLAVEGIMFDPWLHEPENAEYGGAVIRSADVTARLRVGKATPAKAGHFVTVWRRNNDGVSAPFRDDDGVDCLMVVVTDGGRLGCFSFPTEVLRERGIVSGGRSSGKRGFRVYAPWVTVTSTQARRTQAWQTRHFREMDDVGLRPKALRDKAAAIAPLKVE